jgi:hypothetical protein
MSNEKKEPGVDRRGSPRHEAQCEAHLLFIASPLAVEAQPPRHTLIGHTRDISDKGLSLVATSTHVSDYDLCEVGSLLRVKLSLPLGVAEMDTEVIRSEWLDQDDPRKGYFLGVQIMEITRDNRGRYSQYLEALYGKN